MASPMTIAESKRMAELWRKYVSATGEIDLDRLHRCIRDEKRAAEAGEINVSRGLLRELRAELAEVGRIRNRRNR